APASGPTITPLAQWQPVRKPQDFVLWSLFNAMYCNPFCLGFIALVFSVKARDRRTANDAASATSYGRTAKRLNIAALCLGILMTIIFIVVLSIFLRNLRP
ncbi:IFM3 protein, partial [Pedionomus torquatus]|nr:IFM3 protein [Pedionomus torquatus]